MQKGTRLPLFYANTTHSMYRFDVMGWSTPHSVTSRLHVNRGAGTKAVGRFRFQQSGEILALIPASLLTTLISARGI